MASKLWALLLLAGLMGCGTTGTDAVVTTSRSDISTPPAAASSTSTATTAPATTTTALSGDSHTVVLRRDGLDILPSGEVAAGVVTFGDPVEDVVAALTRVLGPPDTDATSLRSDDLAPPGGPCDGGYACWDSVRWTSWDGAGLWLVFFDLLWTPAGGKPPPQAAMAFVGYTSSGAFRTEDGVGVGSTVPDLRAAYGPALRVEMSEDLPPFFSVRLDEHDTPYGGSGYWGYLSGDAPGVTSTVTLLSAGAPSSW